MNVSLLQVQDAKALTQRIVEYLEASGGHADTAQLVAHFGEGLPSGQLPLFRQLLKQVRVGQLSLSAYRVSTVHVSPPLICLAWFSLLISLGLLVIGLPASHRLPCAP